MRKKKKATRAVVAITRITTKDGGEIIRPFKDLPEIPGWQDLTRQQQDSLYAHKRNIEEYEQIRQFGELGVVVELYKAQQEIKNTKMQIGGLIRTLYRGKTQRTVDRKLSDFKEIADGLPPQLIDQWQAIGKETLEKYSSLARASLGEIKSAMKKMLELPAPTGKTLDAVLVQLNTQLATDRKDRRKEVHKDKDESAKAAANDLINYLRSSGITTSAEARQWLRHVVGWTMEARAVTGTVSTERLPYPEGVNPPRGRPRLKPKEAA